MNWIYFKCAKCLIIVKNTLPDNEFAVMSHSFCKAIGTVQVVCYFVYCNFPTVHWNDRLYTQNGSCGIVCRSRWIYAVSVWWRAAEGTDPV